MADSPAVCVPEQLRKWRHGDVALDAPAEKRPQLTASGFLMPARPVSSSRHAGYEVYTPKMKYSNTSTAYAQVVSPAGSIHGLPHGRCPAA